MSQRPGEVFAPPRPFYRPVARIDVANRDRIDATMLLKPGSYHEIAVRVGFRLTFVGEDFERHLRCEIQLEHLWNRGLTDTRLASCPRHLRRCSCFFGRFWRSVIN